jgi:type IV pilus assembly protein PilE
MIAVAVVAILATIAFPSYQDYLRKGRRSAAQSFIVDVAARQQQYLIDARSYAGGAGALGTLNLAVPGDVSRFYTVTIDPAAPTLPPSYTISATPIAGSAQVPDGVLTLDHQGAKTRNGQSGW